MVSVSQPQSSAACDGPAAMITAAAAIARPRRDGLLIGRSPCVVAGRYPSGCAAWLRRGRPDRNHRAVVKVAPLRYSRFMSISLLGETAPRPDMPPAGRFDGC